VALTTVLGYLAAIQLPPLLGLARSWGAAGLTASAGVAGWVEFLLLRRGLDRRIGPSRLPAGYVARLWAPALLAAGAGWGVLLGLAGRLGPIPTAIAVLAPYGAIYLGGTLLLDVPLARELTDRFRRRA
jgi:putative peptidoglycan lipid II flippase